MKPQGETPAVYFAMKLLILFISLIPFISYARWATPQEYDFAVSKFESVYDVKKDGTYALEVSKEFEVLKSAGIEALSTYKEEYNPHSTKVTLVEAWVMNDGKKIILPATAVTETTPTAETVFDELTQWRVHFSDLKVGSKLGLQYKVIVSKPLVQSHFSFSQYFGIDGIWLKEGSITVRSEGPMEVATLDRPRNLKIEKTKKKLNEIKVSLVKPIAQKTVDEFGSYDIEDISAVFFSTGKSWDPIRRQLQSRFELALNSTPTPELLRTIEKAKSKHELEERINVILSTLVTQLSVTGNWRTIKGSFIPRTMKDIFKTNYVDDKEFASVVVIILRKLGYNAHVAIVENSAATLSRVRAYPIPAMNLFNHVIVRLESNGETYWIDPSLKIPFGLNLTDKLTSKLALPLSDTGEIQRLPAKNPDPHFTSISNSYSLVDEAMARVEGNVSFTGTPAYIMSLNFIKNPKDPEFDKQLALKMISYQNLNSYKFAPHKISETEYQKLNFSADLKVADAGGRDTKGIFINVPNLADSLRPFLPDFSDWEMDLYLGEPSTYRRTHMYKNVNLTGESTFKSCEINNKWVHIKRIHNYMNKVLTTVDEVTIKEQVITNPELHSQEFLQFHKALRPCGAGAKFYYNK